MNQSGPPQLPPGWIALWDESAQRYYYVEQATGTTQWEIPTEQSKAAEAGVGTRGEASSYSSGFPQQQNSYPQQDNYPQQSGYPQQGGYPGSDSSYPQQQGGYPNSSAVATSYPTQENYNGQQPQAGMAADGPEGERGIGKIFTGFSGGAITGTLIGLAAGKLLGNNSNHGGGHHNNGGYGNYGPPPGPPPQGYGGYGPPQGYGGYGQPPKKHHHFF